MIVSLSIALINFCIVLSVLSDSCDMFDKSYNSKVVSIQLIVGISFTTIYYCIEGYFRLVYIFAVRLKC